MSLIDPVSSLWLADDSVDDNSVNKQLTYSYSSIHYYN